MLTICSQVGSGAGYRPSSGSSIQGMSPRSGSHTLSTGSGEVPRSCRLNVELMRWRRQRTQANVRTFVTILNPAVHRTGYSNEQHDTQGRGPRRAPWRALRSASHLSPSTTRGIERQRTSEAGPAKGLHDDSWPASRTRTQHPPWAGAGGSLVFGYSGSVGWRWTWPSICRLRQRR